MNVTNVFVLKRNSMSTLILPKKKFEKVSSLNSIKQTKEFLQLNTGPSKYFKYLTLFNPA